MLYAPKNPPIKGTIDPFLCFNIYPKTTEAFTVENIRKAEKVTAENII